MIIPNLMVTDMARSLDLYRRCLGLELAMAVNANWEMAADPAGPDVVFAVLRRNDAELMLQTAASLADELPLFAGRDVAGSAAAIHFRGLHPAAVQLRLPAAAVIKKPVRHWYGMLELCVRDPDGHHVLCLAVTEGPPQARG